MDVQQINGVPIIKGVNLPVPKVSLVRGATVSNHTHQISYLDPDTGESAGTFTLVNYPEVTVSGFTQLQVSTGQIFVEMTHYRRRTNTKKKNSSGQIIRAPGKAGFVTAGYYNATDTYSNPPWPSNFWERTSGDKGPKSVPLLVDRPNFFPVSSINQSIPVWEMLHNRFHTDIVEYNAGISPGFLNMIIPSVGYSRCGKGVSNKVPYSPYYTPYYVAFRYIQYIPNPDNPMRSKIIAGPMSEVVRITNQYRQFKITPPLEGVSTCIPSGTDGVTGKQPTRFMATINFKPPRV